MEKIILTILLGFLVTLKCDLKVNLMRSEVSHVKLCFMNMTHKTHSIVIDGSLELTTCFWSLFCNVERTHINITHIEITHMWTSPTRGGGNLLTQKYLNEPPT